MITKERNPVDSLENNEAMIPDKAEDKNVTTHKGTVSKEAQFRLKILVSIILLAALLLFGKIDLARSWQAAVHANRWYLSLACILFLSTVLVNGYRWKLLAHAVGLDKPLLKMTQYCYVGLFFNMFLPSTVGGDVSRCYYLSKGTGKWQNAFYSVLADRVIGISILFLMAAVGIALGPGGSKLPWQLKWPIYAGFLFVFGVLPLAPKILSLVLGKQNWLTRQFTESPAAVYWQDKKLMAKSLFWSLVLQLMIVVCHVLIGLALGLTYVPIWYYFVFYPSVAVLGFVTPSFNGIGIREWAYTYFLTMMGVDQSHALTYAIIWLGLITLSGLFGGAVYMAAHLKLSPEEMESMQHQSLNAET